MKNSIWKKEWWNNRTESDNSWKMNIQQIKDRNYNLDIKKTLIEVSRSLVIIHWKQLNKL